MCRQDLRTEPFGGHSESVITIDELLLQEVSKGLRVSFEAINELAKDLSEGRRKQVFAKTDRIQRARARVDALLDEKRDTVEFEPDVRKAL